MRPHDLKPYVRKWEKRYSKKFLRRMKAIVARCRRELGLA